MGVAGQIAFVIVSLLVIFAIYLSVDANKFRATVHVVEGESVIGVNPTTESLDFGDLSRGSSAVRRITLKNNTFMPVYVKVVKLGGIADLIDVDKDKFKLAAKQEVTIEFSLFMPASATIDSTYSGRVMIFRMPTV